MSSAARGSVAAQNWAQKRKEQMERAKALREERKHPVASSSYETEAPVRGSAGSRKPTWSENEAAPEPPPPSQYSNAFEDRPIQSQYTSKASSQSINVRQSVTGQEAYSGRRSTTPLQDHAEQDDAHDNPYATTYSLAHATNSSRPQRAQESRMQNNASTTQQSNSIPTSSRQAPGRSFSPAPAPSAAPASAMNSSFSQQQTATYNRNAYDDRDAAEGSIDEDLSIADIRKMSLDLCKELLLYLLEHHYSLMKSVTKFFAGKGESNPKRFIMMNQREQETQQAIPSKPVLKKTQSARISPVSDAVDEEPHYPQRSKTQGPPSNAHMQSNYASSQSHSARGLNERDVSAPQHADTSLTNRNQNRPAESRRPSDPPANANLNHSLQDNSPHGVYDREPQRSKQTSSAAGQPSNSSSKPATQRTAPSQNSAARPSSPSHSHQGSVDQRYKPQYYQYSEPYQSADLGDEQDTYQPTIKPGRQDTTRSNAVAVSNPSSSQRGLPQTTNQKPTRLDPDPPRPSSRGSQRSVTSPPSRHEEAFEAQEDEEDDFGAAAGGQGLVECPVCGRNFAAERIKVHQKICNKVSTKERKVFDSTKHRLEGEAAQIYKSAQKREQKAAKSGGGKGEESVGKVPKWKRDHYAFINAIRSAKGQPPIGPGGSGSGGGAPAPVDDGLKPCPHCGRKFNENAADRHIPICGKLNMKAKPASSGSSGAMNSSIKSARDPPPASKPGPKPMSSTMSSARGTGAAPKQQPLSNSYRPR